MQPEEPTLATPIRILLVDDFEPWRRSVRSMLRKREELSVVADAADGIEAVQKAQGLQPDVILLDIGLPQLNGIDAASRIAQVAPSAKILFVTQNIDLDVLPALSNRANGYVLKVDAGYDLLPAIEAVLRGEEFFSSSLKGQPSAVAQ